MRTRFLAWGGMLLLAAALVVAMVMLGARPYQKARLGDGSELVFRGMTYGTKHSPPGKLWERWLAFLPKRLVERFGLGRTYVHTTEVPSLLFWFDWRNHPPNPQNLQLALADENGLESEASGVSYSTLTRPGESLLGRGGSAFPRRSKTIRVRFYGWNSNYRRVGLAEFVVRNPVWRKYPDWVPERMPVAKLDGDLECTLAKLAWQSKAGRPFRVGEVGEATQLEAYCRIRQGGLASTNWEVFHLTMFDATSNRVSASSWSNQVIDGEERYQFRPTLWPDETAWKVRLELSRKLSAPFSTGEVWVIRGVPVPGLTSFTELNLTNHLDGCEVHFVGLAGARGRLPKVQSVYSGEAHVQVNISPMPDGMRLSLVSAVDDQGREAKRGGAGWGGGRHGFALKWAEDAKTLDITLAFHKSRFVEYLVPPPAVSLKTR